MIDIGAMTTFGAAFAVGLGTGAHCAAMCGPIGCAVLAGGTRGQSPTSLPLGCTSCGAKKPAPRNSTASDPRVATASQKDAPEVQPARFIQPTPLWQSLAAYHLGRVMAYGAWGAAAGAIGSQALEGLGGWPIRVAPWVLIAVILASAFRLDRFLPKLRWGGKGYLRMSLAVRQWPGTWRGLGLGLVTPLLPCGPLYLLLTAALFTADLTRGALFGAAFAAGTIPLLVLGQVAILTLGRQLPPKWLHYLQLSVAGLAVALIAWRALHGEAAFTGIC